MPDGLLSQDSVGGVEHVHVIDNDADDDADDSQDLHAATQCGPELLWGFPFRDGDFVKYERADSTVTIGVAPPNGSHFDNITRIRMRIKTEQCQDGKLFAAGDEGESRVATRWNVNELDGFARTSIAFKADVSNNLEFNDDPDAPANIHRYRAYQLVDPDDTNQGPSVMVWIETHGDHKPEVGELKRLLRVQTELTGGRDD